MKPRILNYRLSAAHERITPLASINDPISISDFDAFVMDPDGLSGESIAGANVSRRRTEIADVVNRKGGIVVCVLRPNAPLNVSNYQGVITKYSLLDDTSGPAIGC